MSRKKLLGATRKGRFAANVLRELRKMAKDDPNLRNRAEAQKRLDAIEAAQANNKDAE